MKVTAWVNLKSTGILLRMENWTGNKCGPYTQRWLMHGSCEPFEYVKWNRWKLFFFNQIILATRYPCRIFVAFFHLFMHQDVLPSNFTQWMGSRNLSRDCLLKGATFIVVYCMDLSASTLTWFKASHSHSQGEFTVLLLFKFSKCLIIPWQISCCLHLPI